MIDNLLGQLNTDKVLRLDVNYEIEGKYHSIKIIFFIKLKI